MVGCHQPKTNSDPRSAVLLLDNHGGYSHAGRKITLSSNGRYIDTRYTDVTSDEHVKQGVYTLNAEKTHLTLSPTNGAVERLYRVDYKGQQYWVHEEEQQHVVQPSDDQLRQVSLKVDSP